MPEPTISSARSAQSVVATAPSFRGSVLDDMLASLPLSGSAVNDCPLSSSSMKRILPSLLLTVAILLPSSMAAGDRPALADVLQPFIDRHELAGAVALVADREQVLAVEAVGFADIAGRRRMRPDDLFWIASQTKPMTAVAVMMLVDEGKVALDDPVEKYLPEFKGQMVQVEKDDAHALLRKPSHPITVREILDHMSGLPFHSAAEGPAYDRIPLAALVRTYAVAPLQSDPGTRYAYSSAGINVAGRIIEVAGGLSYEDFMQRRLFGPLGMKDTTFWPTVKQARRVARSYRPDASRKNLEAFQITQLSYPLSDRERRHAIPAGGLFSTAHDTLQFCRLLLNGGQLNGRRYLSIPAFQELTRRQTPAGVNDNYGLCLALGRDWFGHGGAQATKMEIRPGQGLITVWMVQHAGFPGDGDKAQGVFTQWALGRFGK